MEVKRTLSVLIEKIAVEQSYIDYTVDLKRFHYDASILSTLFNVTLSAPEKPDLKFIAKVDTINEKIRKAMAFDPFKIEIYYYTELHARFEKLEEKYCLPESRRIRIPKLYGLCDDYLKETLVLEDLAAQGFQNFNRAKSADMEYMSAGIDLMAQFHALSMAYYREDPKSFRRISEILIIKEEIVEDFFRSNKAKLLTNALAAVDGQHKTRLQKYFQKPENLLQILDLYRHHDRNILVHGDFKPNNLMHRRRNGKLELAILDFQMVHEGDPVAELMYFIFAATDEQFRRDHYFELLDLYYERLRAALHNLHLDAEKTYPENVYRMQLEECTMLGLVMAVFVLPLILVEDNKGPEFDKEDSEMSDLVAEGSALFKARFNGVINNYVEWGLLQMCT